MADTKMISIEKMDEIMKDYFPETETVDYHGQKLVITKVIAPEDMFELVRQIADGCFAPDGTYMPEVYDLLMRAGTVGEYSNVRLPKEVGHMGRILYGSDLYGTVWKHISREQHDAVVDAVWERINARNNMNKALFENEIQKAVAGIQSLGEQMAQLFGEVSADDIKALVGAIGEGGIDEEKLVQAVVEKQNALREQQPALEVIEGENDGE